MSDTQTKKKVTPIGSCRITQPLRRAQHQFDFEFNKSGVYGYCHSSSEAVQMARFLLANKQIPNQLWPLLSKAEKPRSAHDPSDIYVVELSSAKSIKIDEHSVQLNYLSSLHPEVFADDKVARKYWSLVDKEDQSQIRVFLEDKRCTNVDLLSKVTRKFTTKEVLRHDMKELMTLLPEVLFVTHIDALQTSGEHIPSRSDFITDVEAVAKDLGAKLYNPTSAMRFVGQAHAIAKDDLGLAHYDDQFENLVAQDLGQFLTGASGTHQTKFDSDHDPISKLFALAEIRRSDASQTTKNLELMLETAPKLAAPAFMEHAKHHHVQASTLQALAPHLSEQGRFQLWATHGIGKLFDIELFSDHQITQIINQLRDPKRTKKLDTLLLQIGRPISPILARSLDRFLKFDFQTRSELLDAAKVVLKHAPSHTQAKGALYHIKTWLSAQNYASATQQELDDWAKLNAQLPSPNISVDLKIARQHFAAGNPTCAIKIGLRAQELAPDNLTLAVMLMRAATQSNDPRQKQFAQKVQSLTEEGSKYQTEALRIAQPQSVQA